MKFNFKKSAIHSVIAILFFTSPWFIEHWIIGITLVNIITVALRVDPYSIFDSEDAESVPGNPSNKS